MQIASDVLQLSLALLFIFGGLVCLNLSTRISRKLTSLPVIFPDEEKYQEKAKQREKAARRVVMEWGILVILEIVLSSIGGYLAIGFFGVLFFLAIILISHYINRGRIPAQTMTLWLGYPIGLDWSMYMETQPLLMLRVRY